MTDLQTVAVALAGRSYDIHIAPGLLPRTGEMLLPLLKRRKVAIITDRHVAALHLPSLETALESVGIAHNTLVLEPGEATKSYAGLQQACDFLLASGIERNDLVIAFGGGVIGDLAGFAAGVLRRGVRFVQIPTTLLAQVDSSVGGKTGINSSHGKNLVGLFHQPSLVLADLALLNTLSPRHKAAGYAEVAKYGLLGNADFFHWLDQHGARVVAADTDALAHAVKVSCQMKAEIVVEDETETGRRALLNLGHTFGHALEAATGYTSRLLHGEAVSIGMVQAFLFSARLGFCDPASAARASHHLQRMGLPVCMAQIPGDLPPPERLLEIMRQDKKASDGKMIFILARAIGQAFIAKHVDENAVLDFLKEDLRRVVE